MSSLPLKKGCGDWDLDTDQGYLSPRYYEMLGYEKRGICRIKGGLGDHAAPG